MTVEGQFGDPVKLGASVNFDSSGAAVISLDTELDAQLRFSAGGAEKEDTIALQREGTTRWLGRLENLDRNGDGTLVVQLGTDTTVMFDWAYATALDGTASGVHSADGLFEFETEKGALPAGDRLSVLARPTHQTGKTVGFGPYQLSAQHGVSGRGRFSLPAGEGGSFAGFNLDSVKVSVSKGGAPFVEVPHVTHPEIGIVSFEAESPSQVLLTITLKEQP